MKKLRKSSIALKMRRLRSRRPNARKPMSAGPLLARSESRSRTCAIPPALAARYQEIWGEWLAFSQQATRERIEAAGRVAFAATPQSAFEAQFTMVRREMELFLERNARIAQLSGKAALDARQRIDETADERRAA